MAAGRTNTCSTQVVLGNKHGLHARPAHLFVQTANAYASKLKVGRADSSERVDGKSIMGIMMLAAEPGTVLEIECEGPDCEEQMRAILELIGANFGED